MLTRWRCLAAGIAAAFALPFLAQQTYQRPPREIAELLTAPAPSTPFVSPAGNAMLLATPVQYRPIADLAATAIRGAGVRINPANNAHYLFVYYVALTLQRLPDGPQIELALPPGARVSEPRWNANGSMFAFTNATSNAVELWVGDTAAGTIRRIEGIRINPVLSAAYAWMPDQKTLLAKMVPAERPPAPVETSVPAGPRVEDSAGVRTPSSTYEAWGVLRTPHEADLFEYYTTSQIGTVDPLNGRMTPIGKPDVYWALLPAPGGQYLLVERFMRPYSSIRTFLSFPRRSCTKPSARRRHDPPGAAAVRVAPLLCAGVGGARVVGDAGVVRQACEERGGPALKRG